MIVRRAILKLAAGAPQDILARADEDIFVAFLARAVDKEIRMGFDLLAVVFLNTDVGNQVARARRRHFRPGDFGIGAFDADFQTLPIVVEIIGFAGLGKFVADTFRPLQGVVPKRHPVTNVFGQQLEPLAQLALVEQLGFEVIKILDLVAQLAIHWTRSQPRANFSLASIFAQCMYRLS